MPIRLTRCPVAGLAFVAPLVVFFLLLLLGCKPVLAAGIALASIGATWLVQSGMELDLVQKTQRTYYSAIGYSLGRWKPLPPIVGITLKYFSSIQPNTTPSSRSSWGIWNDASQRNEEIIIMLSVARSSTGMVIKTFSLSELQEATVFAKDLAEQLGVLLNVYLPPGINS